MARGPDVAQACFKVYQFKVVLLNENKPLNYNFVILIYINAWVSKFISAFSNHSHLQNAILSILPNIILKILRDEGLEMIIKMSRDIF